MDIWHKIKDLFHKKDLEVIETVVNRGLIEIDQPAPEDYVLGGEKEAAKTLIQADRDWTEYLPEKELQKRPFETWACVTFSALNCMEIWMKKAYGVDVNYSDRFTAAISGTKPYRGNHFTTVADAIRHKGVVGELEYEWGGKTVGAYYQPIPHKVQKEGLMWVNHFVHEYEWVDWAGCDPYKLWKALKFSPIQVSVYAWGRTKGGVYQYTGTRPNHAVTLFKGEYEKYWYIYDHYENVIKKLAWNFRFGSAMRHAVTRRIMLELLKGTKKPDVYAVDKNKQLHHILNEGQFNKGKDIGLWGGWDDVRTIPQEKMDKMELGEPIVFALK